MEYYEEDEICPAVMGCILRELRIEAPVANCMAMADLGAVHYMTYTDKDTEGFWEAWRGVLKNVGHVVPIQIITEMFMHQLS